MTHENTRTIITAFLHKKLVLKAGNFLSIILNTTFCYLLNKFPLFT